MKAEQTGNILLLKFLCLVVRGASNHAYTGQPPGGCPHIQTMSCGTTTLENGESVAMVPKSLSQEEAWWMHNIAELEGVENRLICAKPDCISNPCVNGGTCQETLTGFECQCTPDFYGITCSCPLIIHTPDVSDTRRYTFPGLSIAPGMTSFDFEVSANNDAHIGLSRSNATEDYMYEMAIGGWENTGGGIRRCIYTYGGACEWNPLRQKDPAAMGLSGIPSYDHYQLSFADGHITLHRYDSKELLMEFLDPNPLEVNFIGIWTGFGSEGYWKFPSLCYDK